MILILLILILTGGNINIIGYYFVWNPLIACMYDNSIFKRWIWIGTTKEYIIYLDKEQKRLTDLKNNIDK